MLQYTQQVFIPCSRHYNDNECSSFDIGRDYGSSIANKYTPQWKTSSFLSICCLS